MRKEPRDLPLDRLGVQRELVLPPVGYRVVTEDQRSALRNQRRRRSRIVSKKPSFCGVVRRQLTGGDWNPSA